MVLKAKYFLGKSILEAGLPRNASWFWQNVMAAREVIKIGIMKKVGDGKSVNIWKDCWIPFTEDGMIKTQRPVNCNLKQLTS